MQPKQDTPTKRWPKFYENEAATFVAGRPPWYDVSGANKNAYLVGITGGSGSGKTTVSKAIAKSLNVPRVLLISMDSFYKIITGRDIEDANNNNYDFDHPNAIDFDMARLVLRRLKCGKNAKIPIYNFVTHSRESNCIDVYGADVVIFEGILTLFDDQIASLFDLKIFIDTDSDTRLSRRILRDIKERGREVDGVIAQYERFVKPNFKKFVAETKYKADIIVPWNHTNDVAIQLIVEKSSQILQNRDIFNFRRALNSCYSVDCEENALSSDSDPDCELFRDNDQHVQDFLFDYQNNECKEKFVKHINFFAENLVEKVVADRLLDGNNCLVTVSKSAKIFKIERFSNFGSISIKNCGNNREPRYISHQLPALNNNTAQVFLADVIVYTGAVAFMGIKVLLDHDFLEENIYIVCLFCSKASIRAIKNVFPKIHIFTAIVLPDDHALIKKKHLSVYKRYL